jgi:uncharacterized protein YkwD
MTLKGEELGKIFEVTFMGHWESLNLFVYYLNGIRQRNGVSSVSLSYQMSGDCQKHNSWMANGGGLNHSGLNSFCWENIAWLGWKPEFRVAVGEILRIWMEDSGHRDILLSSGLYVGMALYYSQDGTFGTFRISRS